MSGGGSSAVAMAGQEAGVAHAHHSNSPPAYGGGSGGGVQEVESIHVERAATNESLREEFFLNVKYGMVPPARKILESRPELANAPDGEGNYAAHWAAKMGSAGMLALLAEFKADLDRPVESGTEMRPIHWAASQGQLDSLDFLLAHGVNINSTDSKGCTPVVVATQHKQLNSVIFLVRRGADMTIPDCNEDNALHWAAYGGHLELTGLLVHCMPAQLDAPDRYGQTPLHLAVLQGHRAAAEYLSQDCLASVSCRDREGKSPLDLAASKGSVETEWFLRRVVEGGSVWRVVKHYGLKRVINSKKLFKFAMCGLTTEDNGVWAWRCVFASNFVGSFLTLMFSATAGLESYSFLHKVNFFMQFLWWFFFLSCMRSPGIVVDSRGEDGRGEYDRALDEIAASVGGNKREAALRDLKLCHSCHVRRPLRAKHDKFLRRCVHKFDHHCPFVGNTVGRDNHRYFLGLMVCHQICFPLFMWTAIAYMRFVEFSWSLTLFLLYSVFWEAMMLGLGAYHLKLCATNMTTNESINVAKYPYMLNDFGSFDNPFCRGDVVKNLMDTASPYDKVFYDRGSVERFIDRRGPMLRMGNPSANKCSSHDHSHDHGHGHSHGHGHDHSAHECSSNSGADGTGYSYSSSSSPHFAEDEAAEGLMNSHSHR